MKRIDTFQIILIFGFTILAMFMLLPLVYLFNHGFKPFHELFLVPPNFIVREPTLQNFIELLQVAGDSFVPVTRYIFNTFIVTLLATTGMILFSALCAFPLSKHQFPGRTILFSTIVISLLFVAEVLGIPRYIVMSELGLMNSYLGHILPLVAMPVGVFLLKQFMDQIPVELLDAAKIDGAGDWLLFRKIIIPIVTPAMATVAILAFQGSWGNMETSTLFMQDEGMKTLAFYMNSLASNLSSSNVTRQGAAAAGVIIMFLPQLIVFLIYQNKVIATMTHSGIK